MRDFDKRFNRMRRFISIFIGAVFILIISSYILIGVIGVKVVKDPEGTAEKAGETARAWKDAFEKGYKVEASSDTIVVDTLNIK